MIEKIRAAARGAHLDIVSALLEGNDTILLLGPHEPGFWAHVTASPELNDGADDPLDRWSKRVISKLAQDYKGTALFPSDGPPYPAFISWALNSEQAWLSPVGMLVHERAGLFASYRGALRIPKQLAVPAPTKTPCDPCPKPCQTACPVNALTATSYDVAACKAHITGEDSGSCRTQGCAARRACPISQSYGRKSEQSAFHMRAFLGE